MKLGEFIASHGTPLTTQAGDHLFHQGDHDQSLYVVHEGLLKAYYLSPEGKEHIKSFILPGDSIGSLMASYAGKACTFSLVCLKPCRMTVVKFSDLYEASKSDTEISSAVVDFLLGFGMKKENREYELLCLSAEERYKRMLETAPAILDLVTQNEIARYLGVTPVGLSRIKKRVTG
ncbi:MAG: Crp/Fnr family transcriptional regulator [Rhizobiaceae bacterium]|nr:Crp/Fnr family transcriptional regulator [Rhizobiaceae bacterium]